MAGPFQNSVKRFLNTRIIRKLPTSDIGIIFWLLFFLCKIFTFELYLKNIFVMAIIIQHFSYCTPLGLEL